MEVSLNLLGSIFIHRDIACRNYLVGSDGRIKLCDYGLCRKISSTLDAEFSNDASEKDDYYKAVSSKIPWRASAPESLTHRRFSRESDMWMYGITLIEMLTGKIPFAGVHTVAQLCVSLSTSPLTLLKEQIPQATPGFLREIILKCCSLDPKNRPSASEIEEILMNHHAA